MQSHPAVGTYTRRIDRWLKYVLKSGTKASISRLKCGALVDARFGASFNAPTGRQKTLSYIHMRGAACHGDVCLQPPVVVAR